MSIEPASRGPSARPDTDEVDVVAVAQAAASAARDRAAVQQATALATLDRRRSRTTRLQRAVDGLPYLGPLLVALATSIWLYDLLLLVRLLVLDG